MKQIPFWTSWWLLHLLVHNTWKKSKSFWAKWVAPRDDAKTLLTLSRNVVDVTATRVFPQDSQMGPHRWNPNKPPPPKTILLLQNSFLHLHTHPKQTMEALLPTLDFKTPPSSPFSPDLPTPISSSIRLCRFSNSGHRGRRKWRVLAAASESRTEPAGPRLIGSVGKCVMGFAATAAALSSVCCDSPALAESLTVAFPVSRAPEVNFFLLLTLFVYFEPCCVVELAISINYRAKLW